MNNALKAPRVKHYIEVLKQNHYMDVNCHVSFDDRTYELLDDIYSLLERISPVSNNGARELWFTAERGTIEDFGDFEEMLADGDIESREEFENWWHDEFPNEVEWYNFCAVEDKKIGYRGIAVGNRLVIVDDKRKQRYYPYDISEFTQWLLDSVKNCIAELENGTYNKRIAEGLPPQHRTGTILRKHLWDVFPESRESFFENLSQAEVEEFVKYAVEQEDEPQKLRTRIERMTANDFYSYCALGYAANQYEGTGLPLREQYEKHADGRDDGLGEIDPDSADAFHDWLCNRKYHGGHPWEVCRGGNSTHISLYVSHDDGGFYLSVAGDAWSRTVESVKFYLALRNAGLPVYMHEARLLADRLLEKEKIGIVPAGIIPAYCESHFPDEKIIDFINLPFENRDELLPYCIWQKEKEVKLL